MKRSLRLAGLAFAALCGMEAMAVTVSDIPVQCMPENSPGGSFQFTVGDAGLFPINVIAISSNPSLIPQDKLPPPAVAGNLVTVSYGLVPETTGEGDIQLTVFSLLGSKSVSARVMVTPPVSLTCPEDLNVVADSGGCGAIVNYQIPIAQGGCDSPVVSCDPAPGAPFAAGVTEVTCSAETALKTLTCSFNVTVTAASISSLTVACPEDVLVSLPQGVSEAPVSYTAPVVTGCGALGLECVPPSGSTFAPGVSTVVCTVVGAGQSVTCSFSVTVEAQVAGFACPRDKSYWKGAADWPVQSLQLGGRAYSREQLASILRLSVRGDASVILAGQTIAAMLNVAHGSDPAPVEALVVEAQAALELGTTGIPCGISPSSPLGRRMIAAAARLEDYNTGEMTDPCVD